MTGAIQNRTATRAGFGKLPERPSFDKKSLASTKPSTSTSTSSSTLKTSVSNKISTSTRTDVFKTRASTTTSTGPFVAGQNNASITYKKDRTVTVDPSLSLNRFPTGYSDRSLNRLLKAAYGDGAAQQSQIQMLQNMNMLYGNYGVQQTNSSPWQFMSDLVTFASGLFTGGTKNVNSQQKVQTSQNEVIAKLQNATTSAELSQGLETANKRLDSVSNELKTGTATLTKLKGETAGLKSAFTAAEKAVTDNKTAIGQKSNEVQNNINRESASQMAWKAAESQVQLLESQLSTAGPMAKAAIESSLESARAQVKTKKEQYEKAVQARETSQQELQSLNDATAGLEAKKNKASADLKQNESDISKYTANVDNLTKEQSELSSGIKEQQARLDKMKEEEDKKA